MRIISKPKDFDYSKLKDIEQPPACYMKFCPYAIDLLTKAKLVNESEEPFVVNWVMCKEIDEIEMKNNMSGNYVVQEFPCLIILDPELKEDEWYCLCSNLYGDKQILFHMDE